MAGWLVVWDSSLTADSVRSAFENIFSGEGLPPLRMEIRAWNESVFFITWAWASDPDRENAVIWGADGTAFLRHGYWINLARRQPEESALGESAEWNGSFCLIRADFRGRTLTLWTDRLASRPVWYHSSKDSLIAANNPSAVAVFLRGGVRLNGAGLWSLFANSRHVGRQGLYDGIANLAAGERVRLARDGSIDLGAWHKRAYRSEEGVSASEWGAEIASALRTSAELHKRISAEPRLFLSGGLDSRIAAAAFGPPLRTLTLTAAPNANSRLAERTARRLHLRHRTIVRDNAWYLRGYEAAALIAAGNYDINHAHFIPALLDSSSPSQPAFLLGDLLENLNKHYFRRLEEWPSRVPDSAIADAFHRIYPFTHQNPDSLESLFQDGIGRRIRASWREELSRFYRETERVSSEVDDRLDDLFRWSNTGLCPTFLMHESIVPFSGMMNLMFENRALDFVFRIPARIKGQGTIHKWTLWHLDRMLAILPNSNSWLPPVFPNSLDAASRKLRPVIGNVRRRIAARGASGPIIKTEGSWHRNHELFRKDEAYRAFIDTLVEDPRAFPSEIFNRGAVRDSWNRFLSGEIERRFEINMLLSFGVLNRRLPAVGLKV